MKSDSAGKKSVRTTKMQSCAWMNGQYQGFGPLSQSSHAAAHLDTMRNQKSSCQYGTVNTGVQPPQSAHFIPHTLNWKNLRVQQPTGGKNSNFYLNGPYDSAPKSFTTLQREKPPLQMPRFQAATHKDFNQNSTRNSLTQSQQSTNKQVSNVGSDLYHHRIQEGLYSKPARQSAKPISLCHTSTSVPLQQVAGTQTLMSPTPASNQNHSTQNGHSVFEVLPDYFTAVSQPYRNVSSNLPSSGQNFHVSSGNWTTGQYATRLNSAPQQNTSDVRRIQTMEPVTLTESYNFNPSQALPSHSGQGQSLIDSSQQNKLKRIQWTLQNNQEILSSPKTNKRSSPSTPGHTGPRTVAVVQPLSQEILNVVIEKMSSKAINQGSKDTTTGDSLYMGWKHLISPPAPKKKTPTKNQNQVMPNKSASMNTEASQHASPSDSDRPQMRTVFCADDTGPTPKMTTSTAHQTATFKVPETQPWDKDKSEMALQLPSLPTTPWTTKMLERLTMFLLLDRANEKEDSLTDVHSVHRLYNMFWDGRCETMVGKLKSGWYTNLMAEVKEFCNQYVTKDSVVLSQMKNNVLNQLKKFHVLKDDEVYLEPPYTSSWLNINKQLDDIDKEFGFPRHLLTPESDIRPEQAMAVNGAELEPVDQLAEPVESQDHLTEPVDSQDKLIKLVDLQDQLVEPVDLLDQSTEPEEEKHSTVKVTDHTDSSDSFYSFTIQVLPPEEAKAIFEQGTMPQSTGTLSRSDSIDGSTVDDEMLEIIDIPSNSEDGSNRGIQLEQICCIERWKGSVLGRSSLSECKCKTEQNEFTDTTLVREAKACLSDLEGENQTKESEDMFGQILMLTWPELFNADNETIDVTDDKDPVCYHNHNCSQASIICINDNKDGSCSGSETEILNQVLDLEESNQPMLSGSGKEDISANPIMEDCEEHLLTPSNVSCETDGQVDAAAVDQMTHSGKPKTAGKKRKTVSSHDTNVPLRKKLKKCKPLVDLQSQPVSSDGKLCVDYVKPGVSKARTVELALFSLQFQNKRVSNVACKSHRPFQSGSYKAPEVVSVKLSPSERKSTDIVKQGVPGTWHLSATRKKNRIKGKTLKGTVASLCRGRQMEVRGGPSSKKDPSDVRIWDGNGKLYPRLKKRRCLSNFFKVDTAPVKQSVDHAEHRSVLKFSILPNTFRFMDGSSEEKSTTDTASGRLCDKPGQQHCSPAGPPAGPKTSGLFQEHQKKFRKRTQPAWMND